jgi:hypothetical protein
MSDGGVVAANLVLLSGNLHLVVHGWLLGDTALLEEAVLDFLLLLDTISGVSTRSLLPKTFQMGNLQIAASAEATSQAVDGEVTGETEAVHDSATLEDDTDRGGRAASTGPPSNAGGVDGAVVLEVGIVVQTMVGLAEGDARAAASDQA